MLNQITFFDLETDQKSKKITEVGAVKGTELLRTADLKKFAEFCADEKVLCGHNIFDHDLEVLKEKLPNKSFFKKQFIDTLFWSALLFPTKPYHKLVKDYKLVVEERNDPVRDARLVEKLLSDFIKKFENLSPGLKTIYFNLLHNQPLFSSFFTLFHENPLPEKLNPKGLSETIKKYFANEICHSFDFEKYLKTHPVELTYCLAIISAKDRESITPPWVLHRFPKMNDILYRLRSKECADMFCTYCQERLSPGKSLTRFYGFKSFRRFDGDVGMPLQERVVRAALNDESFLCIFPTGGGKSLTFQLPALIRGEAIKGLTVVISPLQSLMKDQVDNLEKKKDILGAVTINGLLSPLERSEAVDRVQWGGASILYIAPEALRSLTILELLKNRLIDRFVIDEAHCFSSWGQDFRVDYLYIGKFIAKLQKLKPNQKQIPVSCFTATAKPAVIDDINSYFKKNLNLNLGLYKTNERRKNLDFKVQNAPNEKEKFSDLLAILSAEKGPKIIYVSRTKTAEELVRKLEQYGFHAHFYHGKMDREQRKKIQDQFMEDEVEIIVATTAFGMGVDKADITSVIHYDISNSLENYIQEAGRAGRDAKIKAKCHILFSEDDLNKHFTLLNSTKLNQKEVSQIWRAVKYFKQERFSRSALEIARAAGWDEEIYELETRVKAAIAALEDAGFLERYENKARIFANSILVKNLEEAREIIEKNKDRFIPEKAESAIRVGVSIIKEKEDTKVDHLAEILALHREQVIRIVQVFRELGILGDTKDLTAFFTDDSKKEYAPKILVNYGNIERSLFHLIFTNDGIKVRTIYLRDFNEKLIEEGNDSNIEIIRTVLRYWTLQKMIRKERVDAVHHGYRIQSAMNYELFKKDIDDRLGLASQVTDVLEKLYLSTKKLSLKDQRKPLEFSLLGLKQQVEESGLFKKPFPITAYDTVLLYLNTIGAIRLDRGLIVYYNPMVIQRKELSNQRKYTAKDYEKLGRFYQQKTEQIHIVGEYAKLQMSGHLEALQFVDDYFNLDYKLFVKKYFPKRKGQIKRTLTETKFREIIQQLSNEQAQVVKDNKSKNILVAAGPGSGKTKVLVHKIAALLMMEDIKPEQFLMLAFSRPAANELKERLKRLIGGVAYHIDIFTFHGYCFHLLGRIGTLEKSGNVIPQTTSSILSGEVPQEKIAVKSVLVVDEYQDIGKEEYELLQAVIKTAQDIRVIVVGDDDQNIYEFRGSSIEFMRKFRHEQKAATYMLTKNFRAKKNLIEFSNLWLKNLPDNRIKSGKELKATTHQNGSISIKRYDSERFMVPFVEAIISEDHTGTTGVFVHKNEEALLIQNLLQQRGITAQLILSNRGFPLRDILELRSFSHDITRKAGLSGFLKNDEWHESKEKLKQQFKNSTRLDLAFRVINNFEAGNPKKIISEWIQFMNEIKIEDFYFPDKKQVLVSTMHKVKGKEFDNVFIYVEKFPIHKEEKKRVLYVALTRAKNNLHIHTSHNYFDKLHAEKLDYEHDTKQYDPPTQLILQCSLEDVHLGFYEFNKIKKVVATVKPGDVLIPSVERPNVLLDENDRQAAKFSTKFFNELASQYEKGYFLKQVEIDFIVVWKNKENGKEGRIVLPRVVLEKTEVV